MTKTEKWNYIQAGYVSGTISVSELSRRYSIPESTIRNKIKRDGWIKSPSTLKAHIVREQLASSQKISHVAAIIETEANQDIADMNTALDAARSMLNKAGRLVELSEDGRELKVLSECVKINVDTIRKIRGLDEQQKPASDLENWSREQLEAELARLHG